MAKDIRKIKWKNNETDEIRQSNKYDVSPRV
jgi:hypothetical protein